MTIVDVLAADLKFNYVSINEATMKPRAGIAAILFATALCAAQESVTIKKETIPVRGGGTMDAELGRLKVPENRNKKDSKAITLAFLRVPSPLPNPGPPVFMLAGGPGGSSIDMAKRHMAGGGRPILELFGGDLIAIDQRGVGLSRPNLESSVRYNFPLAKPGAPSAMLKIIQSKCTAEAERFRKKGVDLSGYTTVESADDIDAVRAALGYEKIVLWGESYGSHLALATLRRHEAHIERSVLICPEGPDDTLKLPSDTDKTLARVATLIKADTAWGTRNPDFVKDVKEILERLREKPVIVEVDGERVGISAFDVQGLIADKLSRSRKGIDQLPALIQAMKSGEFAEAARELAAFRKEDGIQSAMAMVMDSASGVSKARASRIATEAKASILGDASNFPYPGVAKAWGAPDLGESFRTPVKSKSPTLMIVGDLDARTTVAGAKELMKHLSNSNLIVVTNVSHDVPWGVPEIRPLWGAFLKGEAIGERTVAGPAIRFLPPK